MNNILRSGQLVKMGQPRTRRKLFFNLARQYQDFRLRGRGPHPDQVSGKKIADRLGVTEKDVGLYDRRLAATPRAHSIRR